MNTKVEPLVYRIPIVNSAFFGACVYVCVCGGGLSYLSLYTYIKRPPSGDTCLSTFGLHFMEQKPLSSFKWCDGLDLVLFLQKKNKQTKPKAWEQGHKRGMGTVETRDPMRTPTECGSKVNTQERGLRMSLVKKKQQVLTAAPFAGLVWSSQTLAPSSCRVCPDPLVYWSAQRRGGRAKPLRG